MHLSADITIIGSGFAGSLTALILKQLGFTLLIIDRGQHPRFAIGESSTPIAGYVLRELAEQYDLPRLVPLTKFGMWQAACPDLMCGVKRGFSYFHHQSHARFESKRDHSGELLVAASADDKSSELHWLRKDVDAFLFKEVCRAGIPCYENTQIQSMTFDSQWKINAQGHCGSLEVDTKFVVDASGAATVVAQHCGVADRGDQCLTNSRAVFSHFQDVSSWQSKLDDWGFSPSDYPFPPDKAALHHLFEGGWMWNLRFLDGLLSAGFVLDRTRYPLEPEISAADEWQTTLQRFPSLQEQFASGQLAEVPGDFIRTSRLQRRLERSTGNQWVALPHTAGFIDPLHSTGIAHSLCGVERLVEIIKLHWQRSSMTQALEKYEQVLQKEFTLIDLLVSGCYRSSHNFRLFAAFAMLYFAAATTYERRRLEHGDDFKQAFLCADDEAFVAIVRKAHRRLQTYGQSGTPKSESIHEFELEIRRSITPFNHAGLCDPSARNMYRYTIAPNEYDS